MTKGKSGNELDVFINCPFDAQHKPLFNATVFTIVRSGYRARCALEVADAGESRLAKIIRECPFSVHDISRTEVDGIPPLPRFNMPLELGLWLGAKYLGAGAQKNKRCVIFNREQYRYQRTISDIAGQDINSHAGSVETLIARLSDWLRNLPAPPQGAGGAFMLKEYRTFEELLPDLCRSKNLTVDEINFSDFTLFASLFVSEYGGGEGVEDA